MGGESGGRRSVPSALVLVRDFVNTNDRERGRDGWDSPAALRRWLIERGLLREETAVDEGAWGRTLAAREALRAMLLANNGGAVPTDAIATLNGVAADAPVLVCFEESGLARLVPGGAGVERALGQILIIVREAMADGTWPRLKACRRDVCRWAFYDASKNRSRAWCAMAVCGSRLKMRAHRARQRIVEAAR